MMLPVPSRLARVGFVALTLCSLAASAEAQVRRGSVTPGTTAIVGATVITMDGERVLRDATVVIRDGRIAAVGARSSVRVPRGATVVEGRGKYVMPGLADMHTHLYADETLPDSIAPDEFGVMLAHGITTARLMIGRTQHFAMRDAIARGAYAGPQLWIASPELSGQQTANGIRITTTDEARAAVRQSATAGYDFIKVTTDITPEIYEAIVAEAAAQRIRVVGHVDPRVGARRAIAAGQQIEHLDSFMEAVLADSAPSRASVSDVGAYQTAAWTSLDHVDDRKVMALAGEVARSGVPVDPTLVFFRSWFGERPTETEIEARPDFAYIPPAVRTPWLRTILVMRRSPPTAARRERFIRTRNAMVKAIVDSGGKVMTGSDAPGGLMSYGWMLHREMLALRDAGLSPHQVLASATTVPADFLTAGRADFGQVREGYRADLLILDADPLADIANTQRISHVVNGGRFFSQADRDSLLARARERLNSAPTANALPPCATTPGADPTSATFPSSCWAWTASHDGTDWITRVRELRDGSVLSVGFVNRDAGTPTGWQAFAARVDAEGRTLWTRTYGGNGTDAFWDARELADGQIAVAGFYGDAPASAWVALLDPLNGDIKREHRFSSRGSTRALGLAPGPQGGLFVVGEIVTPGRSARDVYALRLAADGTTLWERTFGDSATTDRAFYAEFFGGGLVLTGVTGDAEAYDVLTMRLDADGGVMWRQVHGAPGNDANHGLAIRHDQRIIVAGYGNGAGVRGANDVFAIVYNATGTAEHVATLRASGDDRVMSIAQDVLGGIWFTGYSTSESAGGWDMLLARLTTLNQFEPWIATLGGRGDDHAYAIAIARNGDLLLGGYSNASGGGNGPSDPLVLRVNPARVPRRAP